MATVYIEYTVYLGDKAQIATLQAAPSRWNNPRNLGGTLAPRTLLGVPLGGTGKLFCSPERAALEFPGCVIRGFGTSDPYPGPPFISSIHIWANALPGRYPTDQDFFTRPKGWSFGTSTFYFGTDTYIWVGKYAWAPPPAPLPTEPGTPEPIRQLRWAEGFRAPLGGSGGDSAARLGGVHAGASRTQGGYGMTLCDESANSSIFRDNQEFRGTSFKPTASWERLYIQIISLPTSTLHFWRLRNSAGNAGLVISLTTTGNLAVFNQTGASTFVFLGSTGVMPYGPDAPWLKIDLTAAITGSAHIYKNGIQELEIASFPDAGWGDLVDGALVATYHTGSDLGKITTDAASVGGCIRFADWTSHDVPVTVGLAAADWRNGTKVVTLDPIEYGATHDAAVWTKDVAHFKPLPAISGPTANYQTSNNATGPKFSVLLDIEEKVKNDPNAINGGIIAAFFGLFHSNAAGATAGTLDYSIDGAAFVTKAEVLVGGSTTALGWATNSAAYLPSGLAEPQAVDSLEFRFSPGASAHNRTIGAACGVVVVVGIFGDEDIDPTEEEEIVAPPNNGEHNHWYPRSPWATQEFAPISPVIVKAGTYVGNGTVTRLTFRAPVTFFRARRVDATIADGAQWWSSMTGPSRGAMKQMASEGMLRALYQLPDPAPDEEDVAPDMDTVIEIVGNEAGSNANGVTYIYLAFMDPGARFSLCGSLKHHVGTGTRTTPLHDETFTPIAGLFSKPSTAVAVTNGVFYKGPGHSAQAISRLDASETGSALSWAEGLLTHRSAFHVGVTEPAIDFCLFRLDDGSDDPGIPATLQINSYTGDGNASRTLGLIPTGMRPMWAMVVPHNAAAIFRDASHTGTTSSQITTNGALTPIASTGIVGGGIDQMMVGSALNANGIVYDYIIFMGDATACNNGWSCPVEISPIVPIPPIGNGWLPPPDCDFENDELCGDLDDDDDDGDDDGDSDDSGIHPFGDECPGPSQLICNKALGRIGVTDPVTDIVNEVSVQANQCRLYFDDAVQAVLKAFDWKFATRYATLVLVDGSEDNPVNGDWTYSYRLPADCIKPRRLVDSEVGRDYPANPTVDPILFDVSDDEDADGGGLLYTNRSEDEGIELEYTCRPACSPTAGGATFRTALEWYMAAELAPSLSKNDVTAQKAMVMFEHWVQRAKLDSITQQQQDTHTGDPDWITGR